MEVSLSRNAEKIKNYAVEFEQKETGAGGVLARWDNDVLRGSIPDTWDTISGMYKRMDDELADEARNAALLGDIVEFPELTDPSLGLKNVADAIGAALNNMTLSDFVLDPSVADEIENCFIITNQCVNARWTSLADLVEGGVKKVQFGIGGQIMDIEAINTLVEKGREMGGVAEELANKAAAQVEQMLVEMADESLELTISPKMVSDTLLALKNAVEGNVGGQANAVRLATKEVNAIKESWGSPAQYGYQSQFDYFDAEGGGWQFGGLGAAFGDAVGEAWESYQIWKNYRLKRRKQIRGGGGGGGGGAGGGDGGGGEVTSEDLGYDPVGGDDELFGDVDEVTSEDLGYDPVGGDDEAFGAGDATGDTGGWGGGSFDQQDAFVSEDEMPDRDPDPTPSGLSEYDYWESEGGGWQFGGSKGSGGSGGRRGNVQHNIMTVTITSNASIQDILSNLKRIQHMDDASFFNSVS
jgi:hypothetical protein